MRLGNIKIKMTKSQMKKFREFWDCVTDGGILCACFGQVSLRNEWIDLMICEREDAVTLQKAIDRVGKQKPKTQR